MTALQTMLVHVLRRRSLLIRSTKIDGNHHRQLLNSSDMLADSGATETTEAMKATGKRREICKEKSPALRNFVDELDVAVGTIRGVETRQDGR
ncbi:hypothetical protein ACJRO7_013594 [Eucalyptus globulus]|uniref:Uncharacterized protein n=1 Tax=Eucalyptus globulus TaxID=34317 RepID=A0ABD3L3D4_EUCGL